MERLCIRAGRRALAMIRNGGFRFDRVAACVGPAVGPRWLVASGFDLALLRSGALGSKSRPVLLTGSSAGASALCRVAAAGAEKSYRRLLWMPTSNPLRPAGATPQASSRPCRKSSTAYLEDDAVPFALAHDHYRLAVTTARANTSRPRRPPGSRRWGLRLCTWATGSAPAPLSLFSNGLVFLQRPPCRPPFLLSRPASGKVPWLQSPVNFKHAVLASGAIPLVSGVTDIHGGAARVYWDAGASSTNHLARLYREARRRDPAVSITRSGSSRGGSTRKDQGRRPRAGSPSTPCSSSPVPAAGGNVSGGERSPDRDDFVNMMDDPAGRHSCTARRFVEICAPSGRVSWELVQAGRSARGRALRSD